MLKQRRGPAGQSVLTFFISYLSSGDIKETIETVNEDVGNLVDEHFRNCGIENFTINNKKKALEGNCAGADGQVNEQTIHDFLKSQVSEIPTTLFQRSSYVIWT